ncbi:hypothetical protein Raf01_65590 [Rugosimonospora africana]|uniref:Uncharacterized protein n=1 Tax=Rugosimonospora africana TaxID=556532 RepID=A0A8J3VTF6_9ACTN|nr:hypothetical protein Raf01_65590 [Rugosimonospora africana]
MVAEKDRLARFGFEFMGYVAKRRSRKIIGANRKPLPQQEELVEDLAVIARTFSPRPSRMWRYEKQLKRLEAADLTVGRGR